MQQLNKLEKLMISWKDTPKRNRQLNDLLQWTKPKDQ